MRLPQVFHTASGVSFSRALQQFGEESSVVAHAFARATYTDQNEIVWLVARVESKLEADAALVASWLDLLEGVARQSGIVRTQMWLIANEGFSPEASELLRERNAYGSSRQQFDILASRLSEGTDVPQTSDSENEFQLIFPMGHAFEPMKDFAELTPEERSIGYRNPSRGDYRLATLAGELRSVLQPALPNVDPATRN